MSYPWMKTVIGALLVANFSTPLFIVASNRELWEEPMALLAGNLALSSTVLGINIALVGIYDLADFQSVALCRFLLYSGVGLNIAFKTAQMCAAVDQFVAVTYPLSHYSIMMRVRPWLLTATWFMWAVQIYFGFVAHTLDMETFSEHIANQGINTTFTDCRWETALANVYTIIAEMEMVTLSFVTAGLLIYTGVVGYRVNAQLIHEERQQRQHGISNGNGYQNFLVSYRAFKRIMVVLSLLTVMDVVVLIVRISSRWQQRPERYGVWKELRLFGFVLEGWAYGLLNEKLRAAYRKALCGRSRQATPTDFMMAQYPPRQDRQEPSAAGAAAALQILPVESAEVAGRF